MLTRFAVRGAWAFLVLGFSSPVLAEPPRHTSFGLELARSWFAREKADARAPAAYQVGAWLLRDLTPSLAMGVEATRTVFPYGCSDGPGCYPYNLLRAGALAELRRVIVADEHQALEVFGSLSPGIVRYSRGEHPAGSTWGAGATARTGIRVRMRWLTLAPHGNVSAFTPGSHWAYGFALHVGVRLADTE